MRDKEFKKIINKYTFFFHEIGNSSTSHTVDNKLWKNIWNDINDDYGLTEHKFTTLLGDIVELKKNEFGGRTFYVNRK